MRLPSMPPRGRSGAWLVALGIALLLVIQPMWSDQVAAAVAGAILLTILAASRWQLRWLPVIVLVASGVILRLANWHIDSSDVDDVTRAALERVLAGLSPYGLGYGASEPPGAGWPYGPVAVAWYLPTAFDPTIMEWLVSTVLLVALALRAGAGRPLGLAIFAVAPPLVLATVDGSNDTSAGFLILLALVVAARRPVAGAALLAIAVAFKPYAAAWLPPLVALGGLPVLAGFVAASVAAWSPVLLAWGLPGYLRSLHLAELAHLRNAYWSLGAVLDGLVPGGAPQVLETLRYGFGGVAAAVGFRYVRVSRPTIDGVIFAGTATFVAAQFGGYFGSYVYLAALAPILCWRVDDWFRTVVVALARDHRSVGRLAREHTAPVTAPLLRPRPATGWLAARTATSNAGRARRGGHDQRERPAPLSRLPGT